MAKNDTSIVIDTKPLSLIIEEGDKFLLDPKAEDVLVNWKNFLDQVEEAKAAIEQRLTEEMEKRNILKIEGKDIKVLRIQAGAKYELYDIDLAKQQGFTKTIERVSPDTKAIDEYSKTTGELPEGIKLRDRAAKASIRRTKGEAEYGNE